jgi:hypothetical protein
MTAKRLFVSSLLAAIVAVSAPVAVAQSGSELLLAASEGDMPGLHRCLMAGVPLDTRDEHGNTALILAAQQGHKRAVLALLAAGADLEATDENGYTALIWAAQQGHSSLTDVLLMRGANIDAREKHDYTALEWATWEGRTDVVRLLLNYGADPLRKTRWGFNARDLAQRQGKSAVVALFPQTQPRAPRTQSVPQAQPQARVQAEVQPQARRGAPAQATVPSAPRPTPTPVARREEPGNGLREVGRSKRGLPIHLASVGTGDRAVLFVGSIHGDEPQGTDVIHRLLRESPRFQHLLTRNRLLAIPNANPDGVANRIRTNLAGVDLNRNFPTRWRPTLRGRFFSGPRPLSEPESQTLVRVIEAERPSLIVAFHAHMACNNYDGAAAAPIARAMSRSNGYRLLPHIGYETPGSLGQHASNSLGIPIVTLEVGFEPPEQLWRKVRDSLIVALEPSITLGML